jgi:hypothetical protein
VGTAAQAASVVVVLFLGGVTWGSCTGNTLANQSEPYAARKNGGALLDYAGFLYISGGQDQSYSSQFSDGILYQAYNDVWKSSVSFTSSAATLASLCNLTVPACGVGLQCWPPSASCSCTKGITFTALTASAPWEARNLEGLAIVNSSISFTAVGATTTSTLPGGSIIMYGGSNLMPNPNNGSGTSSATEHDVSVV